MLSYAIGKLARRITKWSSSDDAAMHRMYQYLDSHSSLTLRGVLDSNRAHLIVLQAFADADLGGDTDSVKSTSGMFIRLWDGENAFPLEWGSKLQSVISTSTCEAEIVSMAAALKAHALVLKDLLSVLLGRDVELQIMEDNMSAIQVVARGYCAKLAHLPRTHKLSLGWVHEVTKAPGVKVLHCRTEDQLGDMFTKPLDKEKLAAALCGIGMT